MDDETLQKLVQELELYFTPLIVSVEQPDLFYEFFSSMGWHLGGHLGSEEENLFSHIAVIVNIVEDTISIIDDPPEDSGQILALIRELQPLINTVRQLPNTLSGISIPELSELPADLFLHLTALYIFNKSPFLFRLLELLTIIHQQEVSVLIHDGSIIRLREDSPSLDLNRIGDLLTDPGEIFSSTYWPDGFTDLETTNAVARRLFTRIGEAFIPLGIVPFYGRGEGSDELTPEEEERLNSYLTFVRRFSISDSGDAVTLGSSFGLLPKNEGGPGVILLPFGQVTLFEVIGEWGLGIELEAAAGGVQITGDGFSLIEGASSAGVGASIRLQKLTTQGAVAVLIGDMDGTHFEIGSFSIELGFDLFDDRQEFRGLTALNGLKLVVKGGEGDSFLNSILSEEGLVLEASVEFGYSSLTGFHFKGSGGLEIYLPTHISLGPIELQALVIALKITDQGQLPLEMGANVSAELGPLKAVVENLGLKVTLGFPDEGDGNLGIADLGFGFKPPNGVGLSIDAAVVKGGGYLYFDFDKEEYAGALELVFSGFLTLKAIGLITTRLPDGSKGFSLLIIITAEFGTGFQLGFGFVLLGVGGLVGLNRTMKVQLLAEGVRTGATESIMFPQNVVENAPRIISDLRKFFPPEEGLFLIGPMAKLGWGTPSLITLSLGIIIEIPGNIAILGILKLVLPDEKVPLLVLQVNFIGAIEFDKQRAYFFASIFESRVLFITLEGEMGVLVAWGKESNFVVSVGGFHPQFTPPPLPFPTPKRVSLNILDESWGRIRVMGYFAVTSNTVQMGARAELFFGFSEFKIEGHLAFDALFQFDPFFFIIEISCGVSLKVFGLGLFSISLQFSLEGPTPWRAKGYGKLKLLFFTIKANFDFTWGEEKDTSLPPIEVLPLLHGEFKKLSNWQAQLPASSNLLVSLRVLEEGDESLVLHPLGTLTVTQRAVPLDIHLDKVGNQKPIDGERFYLEVAGDLKKVNDLTEQFAIAQFQDFNDNDKLSQAAFQPEDAGCELAVSDQSFTTGKAVKRNIRYETHIIDSNFLFAIFALFNFVSRLFNHFLNGSVVTKSELSQHYKRQLQPYDEKIALRAEQFVVASTINNTALSQQAIFTSEVKAQEFMRTEIAKDPTRRGLLHVISADEVNTHV